MEAYSVETWRARATALVRVPCSWSAADVAIEAAEMWKHGWSPACQGGVLLFVSADEDGGVRHLSLGDVFEEADDPEWTVYAGAVWERLVEVCEAMTVGNRRWRRARKMGTVR
jgi:hypothetical protein